jgi:hypothetical protein
MLGMLHGWNHLAVEIDPDAWIFTQTPGFPRYFTLALSASPLTWTESKWTVESD